VGIADCATREGESIVALTWIRTHDWDADEWRDRAACRDTSPELFFPIGTTGVALDQIDSAKRVCTQCPVASECLDFALATNQEAGVWGGLTEEERRRLRKGIEVDARVPVSS
jgi:WhiB family redox-sensing transcriptional regulator